MERQRDEASVAPKVRLFPWQGYAAGRARGYSGGKRKPAWLEGKMLSEEEEGAKAAKTSCLRGHLKGGRQAWLVPDQIQFSLTSAPTK